MRDYSINNINDIILKNIDALLVVSAKENVYKALSVAENFKGYIDKEGSYQELLEKLCFHIGDTNGKITEDYHVFLPKVGEFKGKVAQKVTFETDGVNHVVQMMVYPIEGSGDEYVIALCDLDQNEYERKEFAENKVKTIQKAYLFSMYVDLNKDISSSINVTEISNDDMHYDVKYTEWRMMIVNMIWPEDQPQFLEKTDPEYLKSNLKPGKTLSFDCQMKNLEGEFIWVKLIFGRTDTTSESDFRFVFMVENIHESSMQLFCELKKFEEQASHDALTGVFNHGRIETEMSNALSELKETNKKISLMMFDIDWFKKINDTFGHAVGDDVLKEFVDFLCEQLKSYNIEIGRWGGEEFVCVCYDLGIDNVKTIAENVRENIANKSFTKIGKMTCSVGISGINSSDTVKEVFERLDKALYSAKLVGRNCVMINS